MEKVGRMRGIHRITLMRNERGRKNEERKEEGREVGRMKRGRKNEER